MKQLVVNMFGDFTIKSDDKIVSDTENRSRKLWFLLAYLIYNRHRVVKPNELIDVLWGENERGANSVGALKTLFYRARSVLDTLWDGAGKQLILNQSNGYIWNSDFELLLDYERFDALNKAIDASDEVLLDESIELLKIHRGEFLNRLSSELWVIPIATYYHNSYVSTLLRILPLLLDAHRYDEVIDFCHTAVLLEPYNEEIHCHYMRAYVESGHQKRAIEIYQKLSDRLLSELGIIPSAETRRIYHEAVKSTNEHTLSLEMLQDQLREDGSVPGGAMMCEYDFFRVLYHSFARSVLRSGIAVHLALFTLVPRKDKELSVNKRERIIANFGETIRCSLRRGDAASRCSASQYVVLLPRANYEDSCKVCERIAKSYYQNYTRLDAEFRFEVFPILPDHEENRKWMG